MIQPEADTPSTALTEPIPGEKWPQVLDVEQRRVRVRLLGSGHCRRPAGRSGSVCHAPWPRARRHRAPRRSPPRRAAPRARCATRSQPGRPVATAGSGGSSACAPSRIEEVVEGPADEGEREDDEDDADARRHEVPPRPEAGRPDLLGRIEQLAPRRLERIAEADERQRRLGQDGARRTPGPRWRR